MKDEKDISLMYNFINDFSYTGRGNKYSKRKTFFTTTFLESVEKNQNKTFGEITDSSDDLQGEGVKIIIPSYIFDINTRLGILIGLKLPGLADTLTEASNLKGELYRMGERQNEQQHRNALNKFNT